MAQDVLVVVPARDEEDTVGSVVRRARKLGLDVVVIDDARSDRTAERAREAGAVVLSAPFNLGAWIATQTGIRYALSRNYAFAVTLDADGQHDPVDIPRLLEAYENSPKPSLNTVLYWDRTCIFEHLGKDSSLQNDPRANA